MRTGLERDITFFDCAIDANPGFAPRLSMKDIACRIKEIYQTPGAVWWSKDKRRKVFLRAVDIDVSYPVVWLLLYSNDADGPGASFANLVNDVQRDEDKDKEEGRPESAHVAIWLEPISGMKFRYLMLLELAPTLGRIRVQAYLNHLLRAFAQLDPTAFRHPDPDGSTDRSGKPKTYKFTNSVELQGHLSNEFKEDLEAGRLNGITLETGSTAKMGVGKSAYFIPKRSDVRLSPRTRWKDHKFESIKDALRVASAAKYENVRVVFQTADNVGHCALLDSSSGNIINEGYVKRVRITSGGLPWKEASTSIESGIQDAMKVLLLRPNTAEPTLEKVHDLVSASPTISLLRCSRSIEVED